MALLTPLSHVFAEGLLAQYGLALEGIEPLTLGSVNSNFRVRTRDGRCWFARLYEEQSIEGASRELRLLTELHAHGVPVAVPEALPSGEAVLEHEGKPFALFPWVDGQWLCQGRVTPAACRAVGDALAIVHLATDRLTPLGAGRFRVEDIAARLDRIQAEAAEALEIAAQQIRSALRQYASQRDPELPSGLIHGDLFRDNTLFDEAGRLVALLDFESASFGPFAFDLMVTVLAWCYTDRFEPALAQAMLGAYNARRPLLPEERAALPVEGALACLRFAATRITDFSMRCAPGETPARDYRRFLERLKALESGALEPLLEQLPSEA